MSQHPPNDRPILDLTLEYLDDHSHLLEHLYFVFDLDSTLYDVSPRTQRILSHFAETQATRLPELAKILKQVVVLPSDWGLQEALARHTVALSQELLDELHRFWRFSFFSNEFLHLDSPMAGAVDYVQTLYRRGAQIIYLTGRDQIRMAEGTQKSLRQHGFPLDDARAKLALKPHFEIQDDAFKSDYLRELAQGAQRIWFFENEPVNIHGLQEKLANLQVIFFDSTHSGRLPPPQNVPYITHFRLAGYKAQV